MRTLTVIAVFAILIVATFGAGYLAGNGNGGTRTITSTSTSISTSTTTVSTSSTTAPFFPGAAATAVDSNRSTGLDLVLALNSTTLKIGQTLQVDISIFNALPSAISIPASQDWPFRGVPVALWPACYSTGPMFDTPAYAVVFQGNYTVQQLQSVANVTISFMCMEAASVDHVVLQPDGSQAYLTGSGFGPEPGPYQLSLNFTTNGYWDLLNSTNAVVGDDVCIAASMSKSTVVSFEVIGQTGVFFSTPGCVNSAFTAVSCEAYWDTAQTYRGNQIQPGDYELIATGDSQSLRANFTLLANSESSSTCTNQSSSSSTSSGNGQGHYVASAVTPSVFFNNSIYQGPPVNFTVIPGSHARMAVNVSYPWQNVQPPPAQGFCVEFSFTIGPFPASSNVSTIPSWMHVSMSPPSVEIPYGSNASVNLLASVDNTAPQDSSASFELLIHYLDPASGNSVVGSYIMSIQT